ncbi:hypothetical protein OHA19_33395 [Streptomyces sp. NBC_00012]|uniref:hypothetical protein n=1 Tax=unclassified Streptomyces TaxID=2593676 RepID=UPI00324D8FAF
MTGLACAAHRAPARQAGAGTRATGTDRTVPPGTTTATTGAVHPVPKSFRSKERQS